MIPVEVQGVLPSRTDRYTTTNLRTYTKPQVRMMDAEIGYLRSSETRGLSLSVVMLQMEVNEAGQLVHDAQRRIDRIEANSTPFQVSIISQPRSAPDETLRVAFGRR